MENVSARDQTATDVTIIWCASRGDKTVIVGWYEHAIAHRTLMPCFSTPISGLERCYWFETEAENAYLLPESKRNYEIKRASRAGVGQGFGQYNYWFADSEYAKREIIPQVLDYISNNRAQPVRRPARCGRPSLRALLKRRKTKKASRNQRCRILQKTGAAPSGVAPAQ